MRATDFTIKRYGSGELTGMDGTPLQPGELAPPYTEFRAETMAEGAIGFLLEGSPKYPHAGGGNFGTLLSGLINFACLGSAPPARILTAKASRERIPGQRGVRSQWVYSTYIINIIIAMDKFSISDL